MGRRRVIVRFGGQWEGLAYLGGSTVVVHMDDTNDDRDHLMNLIRDALCGRRDSEYVLSYLTVLRDGSRCRALLDSDTDLLRLLVQEKRSDPMVYVFERDSVFASEVDVEGSGRRDTFEDDDDRMPPETEGAHISDDEEDERRKNIIESVTTEFLAWIRQPEQVNRIFGHQNFTSEHQTGRDDDELRSLGNWSIPLVECDSALPLGWVEQPGPFTSELVVGATFQSKYELKMVVGMYHLEHMLEYVIDRSTRNRIVFLCKHGRNNCTFRLCAQGPKDEGDSIWYITKLTLDHSCHLNVIRTAERTVTAKVAAVYFARRLVCEGVYLKPREMMEEMRREFGVHMLYSLALETRNIAIEKTYGDFDKSYQMVPSYLHLLRQRNPGTEYNMQISSEGVFCHMFLALGQCIRAFERYLRPVIVLDGTHLKGRNKGVLFVAVSKDGNEQLFPIAIGIGPIENDESWTWFLSNLRRCFDPPDELLIVSDQHKSIANAVKAIYPTAAHGLCFHHMQKNLTRYGRRALAIFQNAAYAYRVEEFEKNFSALKASCEGAHTRLSEIGAHRWSRSHCPVRRYSFMTSNAAESLNSRLLWARRLPICSLLEVYRCIVEKWFDEKRALAREREHEITLVAFNKLAVTVEAGHQLVAQPTTDNVYKVKDKKMVFEVDLGNWTCECREFDQDKMPCRHAAAALRTQGNSVNLFDFVSRYYKQHDLRETYRESIRPVPHPDEWNVPPDIARIVCLPPVGVRQAGRPRTQRVRSAVEGATTTRRSQKCSKCKGTGHNRKNCTEPLALDVDLNVPPEGEPSSQRRRRKKKCSNCGSEEHTITRCPMHL